MTAIYSDLCIRLMYILCAKERRKDIKNCKSIALKLRNSFLLCVQTDRRFYRHVYMVSGGDPDQEHVFFTAFYTFDLSKAIKIKTFSKHENVICLIQRT